MPNLGKQTSNLNLRTFVEHWHPPKKEVAEKKKDNEDGAVGMGVPKNGALGCPPV